MDPALGSFVATRVGAISAWLRTVPVGRALETGPDADPVLLVVVLQQLTLLVVARELQEDQGSPEEHGDDAREGRPIDRRPGRPPSRPR
jgi:hypothetical protein